MGDRVPEFCAVAVVAVAAATVVPSRGAVRVRGLSQEEAGVGLSPWALPYSRSQRCAAIGGGMQ